MLLMNRREWSGMRHIPLTGGAILACNHISQADPLSVAHYVYNSGRNPHFLAKDGVFKLPVFGPWIKATGQIPVYRGGADAVKSLYAAIEAVRDGQVVTFYPEGTTTREPDLWPMRGRTGIARLALETGVPVIPVTVWGPHHIYNPVTRRVRLRPRTAVNVTAGEPVDLSRWQGMEPSAAVLNEVTDAVMTRLRDQLARIRGEVPPPLYDPKATVREDS
ncbi:1-acyl-sn-glycerol-3-phosphate acyltransferase [Stackebrandtia albiflava]